ncbi:hypothetical protein LguiA_004408 [Lonicera macranthoides]
MAKLKISSHGLFVAASVTLNVFLLVNLYIGGLGKRKEGLEELSWSRGAAAEAEAVASVYCSGHGRAYLDGEIVDGKHVCECNTCFEGSDCSLLSPDCVADADSGDPTFLEPFWMKNAASSALMVTGWHRMSYSFEDHTSISHELEETIRKLHSVTKNAVTEGRYIMFGCGSTQVVNAAVYALSENNNSSSSPSQVVVSKPYYPLYEVQTDYFKSVDYEFEGDTSMINDTSNLSNIVIEFVTSPNNPDGLLKKAVLSGPNVKTVNDHAYYWPHFTAIPAPADEDLMIFTLSKVTGHAGSRFGWAIVKDEALYERMVYYMEISEMGISRDIQLRALKLLKVILQENGDEVFQFAYKTMSDRWEKLTQIFSYSKRFSIQKIPPQYCTYFQKVRGPSPAYAWVKCENEEDKSCTEILREANIIGRDGTKFGATKEYVRLSLLKRKDDFDQLLHFSTKLISDEMPTSQVMWY